MTDDYNDFYAQGEAQKGDSAVRDTTYDALPSSSEFRDAIRSGDYAAWGRLLESIESVIGDPTLRFNAEGMGESLDALHTGDSKDVKRALAQVGKHLPVLRRLRDSGEAMSEPIVTGMPAGDVGPKWLMECWVLDADLTTFIGDPGAGKSFLALQLACALVMPGRRAWIDAVDAEVLFVEVDRRVLYVGRLEDGISAFAHRVGYIADGIWPDGLGYKDMTRARPIWEARGRYDMGVMTDEGRRVLDMCTDGGYGLLVLDSLGALYAGNENDRAEVSAFLAELSGWAHQTGTAVVLMAHLAKYGEAKAAGYSGSTGWQGGVRHQLNLDYMQPGKRNASAADVAQAKEYRRLKVNKSNYVRPPPPLYIQYEPARGYFLSVPEPV